MPSLPAKPSLAFLAGDDEDAKASAERLARKYGNVEPEKADVIVALGGDGFMLATQHRFVDSSTPVYGMNKGTIGFLMNEYHEDDLIERIRKAETFKIHPLRMRAIDRKNKKHEAIAINEVSLLRQSYQAAKLEIKIDGKTRLDGLICDGVLVSTPAGSTAYNLSAHGPILPLEAPLLALTPVSPFRPRRWRGALLPNESKVEINVIEPDKRPVNAVADHTEIKSVKAVEIRKDKKSCGFIMFDREHSWDERILREQFTH